jgi:beta-glucanase (GH16 family)
VSANDPAPRRTLTVRRIAVMAVIVAIILVVAGAIALIGTSGTAREQLEPPAPVPATPRPTGIAGRWHLVWADDFAGSALDPTKWSTGWFGSGVTMPVNSSEELAAYDPSQVAVRGGMLELSTSATPTTVNGTTYPYVTGMVSTIGHFRFAYGTIEARVFLPATTGGIANWPAVWTNGSGPWPTTGEMDVIEGSHGRATYHFHSPAGSPGGVVARPMTGWHTVAAEWTPSRVTYVYDGRPVGVVTRGITGAPMSIILDYAVRAIDPGLRVAPATMKVDYVRVWQSR